MRQNKVDHHPHAKRMGGFDHGVKIGQGAKHRIDVAIVRNVVTKVLHWRGKERRNPDRIDTKRGDIGQPLNNPKQITDAVAIAVLKAAWVDLIDHRAAPPVLVNGTGYDWGMSQSHSFFLI